jgi:hypothetical protein
MEDFLLDCCFNADNEVLKFRKSTPHYAALLGVYTKYLSRTMQLNIKHNTKFSGRLRAMPHKAESPHIRENLCKIEAKFENILG